MFNGFTTRHDPWWIIRLSPHSIRLSKQIIAGTLSTMLKAAKKYKLLPFEGSP